MSDLQKFDPSQLMQGVKDRVKATFVSLIPDEQWEGMIQKEVDEFFKMDRRYNDYNSASPFTILARSVLQDLAKEKLHAHMQTFTCDLWEDNAPKLNDELKNLLIAAAPEILTNMFKGMFQQAVNNTRNY